MISPSDDLTKNPELEALIKDVKCKIRKYYRGIKEQIDRTGNFLKEKKLVKERDICIEIKSYLKEEIEEHIISERTIDRCCPDEWKRKTKPKKERQMSFFEGKKEPEQVLGTYTNSNVTPAGQVLEQEFQCQDRSKVVEEQVLSQPAAQTNGEQESEANKLKDMKQEEVWLAKTVFRLGDYQLPIAVRVNCAQKKVEPAELDFEGYYINDTD